MRHMQADKEHKFTPGHGHNIGIGDTVKFGRVRYKIVMTHSDQQGLRVYKPTDRFNTGEPSKSAPKP